MKKREESSLLGKISDIVIENILSHVRGTSTIIGHQDHPIENIRMTHVQISMNPEDAKDKRATNVLEIENVHGLRIRDLNITFRNNNTKKAKKYISYENEDLKKTIEAD